MVLRADKPDVSGLTALEPEEWSPEYPRPVVVRWFIGFI